MQAQADAATLTATVERLVRLGFEVRVEAVAGDGQRVSVQLTRAQADELALEPGREINLRPQPAQSGG